MLVIWAWGRLLFRCLDVALPQPEHDLLAAASGAPLLSLAVFLLCAVHAAFTSVFLAVGAVVVALNWRFSRAPKPAKQPPTPQLWAILFAVLFGFYALLYLSSSLAPEISPDGQTYHLGLVARYFREHGFHRITTNMYAGMPARFEMLFLFASPSADIPLRPTCTARTCSRSRYSS